MHYCVVEIGANMMLHSLCSGKQLFHGLMALVVDRGGAMGQHVKVPSEPGPAMAKARRFNGASPHTRPTGLCLGGELVLVI